MKIINKPKPRVYDFQLSLTQEEAIKLCEEIGEWNQDKWGINWHSYLNEPKSTNARLYMVLSDTLQDLGLKEMTPNRKKGEKSYPRLDDDEVEVTE